MLACSARAALRSRIPLASRLVCAAAAVSSSFAAQRSEAFSIDGSGNSVSRTGRRDAAAAGSRTSKRGMAAAAGAGAPRIKQAGTTLIVEPHAKHTGTVILMHGLGDTAEGWIDVAAGLLSRQLPHVKFILPTAPVRPITLNGGYPMPGWYDIKSLSSDRTKESCDGIEESRATIMKLIAEETATGEGKPGLAASRIALAGFSQGGAMSLFVGLNYPQTLAGMVVLSGYLPLPDSVKPTAEALATPLLHCHGDEDGVVPLAYGRDAHDRVKTMGVKDPQFKVYEGLPHSASDEELRDVVAFFKRILPATDA